MRPLGEFRNKRARGRPIYVRAENVTTVEEQPGGGTRIFFKSDDGKELQHIVVEEPVDEVRRALS